MCDSGNKDFSRRDFGKLALGSTLIIAGRDVFPSSSRGAPEQTSERYSLHSLFQNPPANFRPFFRWWWNGNRVHLKELKRELDLIQSAGIGGVEINPIGLQESYKKPPGIPMEWLSEEWLDILKETAKEAQSRGLETDLIVGTGWPFGGTFLKEDEIIQGIEIETQTVEGPLKLNLDLSDLASPNERIIQIRRCPDPLNDLGLFEDLPPAELEQREIQIAFSAGSHRLQIVKLRRRFRDVQFGAQGGDGPVLDHFKKKAVERYFSFMGNRLEKYFGNTWSPYFRSLFCDSIELEGANWTDDLPQEFHERRGYRLTPFLSLLLDPDLKKSSEIEKTLSRVRFDYSLTLAELFMERFILPFHQWCRKHGIQSRYQAYGYPWLYTDLLDGYRIPDIPEGDQWLFNAGWVKAAAIDEIRYSIWNKYASSAGHLEGRKIISSEAMTNTSGVFEASLEYIKQATDLDFIGGINHLVLHGFNYSPPEAGIPGWVRFGTYFSEYNPWWKYLHLWSDYAARLSSIFQESKPLTQLAILGPTPDVWSRFGLDRNPWNTTPWYLHAIWQSLNNHGYLSDYISAEVLNSSQFKDGKILYKEAAFQALIVVEAESIDPRTARSFLHYAKEGGTIIFVGHRPTRSPGFMNHEIRDRLIHSTMEKLETQFSQRIIDLPPPAENRQFEWARGFIHRTQISPIVEISKPDKHLFFIQHQYHNKKILFFVNSNRKNSQHFTIAESNPSVSLWEWDPHDGKRSAYSSRNREGIEIRLAPLESKLLVFDPEMDSQPVAPNAMNRGPARTLNGPWSVEFNPISGDTFHLSLDRLIDFADHPDLKSFSGVAVYRNQFVAEAGEKYFLNLGKVCEIAEIHINGIFQGISWYGNRELKPLGLQEGLNHLEIHISTLSFNYFRTIQDDPSIQFWMNRTRTRAPLPSGLIGPVRLIKIVN